MPKKKFFNVKLSVVSIILVTTLFFSGCTGGFIKRLIDIEYDPALDPEYQKAMTFYEKGQLTDARRIFLKLDDYKKSEEMIKRLKPLLKKTYWVDSNIGCSYEYDKYGRCIKVYIQGDYDEEIINEIKYDEEGRVVYSEYKIIGGWDKGYVETNEYVYGENGECKTNINNRVFGNGDSKETITSYKYDKEGVLTEESGKCYEDEYAYISTYTYDANKNLTTITTTYNSNGSTISRYEYDDNKNLTKTTYIQNDEIAEITTYEYDANNNCIKEIYENLYEWNPHSDYTIERTYDEKGRVLTERYNEAYNFSYLATMIYNELGELTKSYNESSLDGKSEKAEKSYEYEYKKLEKDPQDGLSENNIALIQEAVEKHIVNP